MKPTIYEWIDGHYKHYMNTSSHRQKVFLEFDEKIKEWIRDAKNLAEDGFYAQALTLYQQAKELEPDNGLIHFYCGDAEANLGQFEKALTSFNRAVELLPNHGSSWIFRAVALIHLERYVEALSSCDRAISIDANDQEAWLFHGVALQRLGKYRQAYASFKQATERAGTKY